MINTKRLQIVLNEMAGWEQEIFEGEYSDMNWYKGKQARYAKEIQQGKKPVGLSEILCLFSISPDHLPLLQP